MILLFGALLGLISVLFGAFAEHGLKGSITDEQFRLLTIALRYNQVHAVMGALIGLSSFKSKKMIRWSGCLFIIGTVLFSFSIYLAVWLDIPRLLQITPIGGVLMMAAWLFLLLFGVKTAFKGQGHE